MYALNVVLAFWLKSQNAAASQARNPLIIKMLLSTIFPGGNPSWYRDNPVCRNNPRPPVARGFSSWKKNVFPAGLRITSLAYVMLYSLGTQAQMMRTRQRGRSVRRVRCSYGVRTVSRTVFGTVFGPCVARRKLRRTDLGFSNFIFDTEICLEAITHGKSNTCPIH